MSKAAGRTQRHRRKSRRREPVGLQCVHRMFEEQARRAPGAVALSHRGEMTSYGELEAMADRIARRLRSLGAGPETLVGVCLRRSPSLVAALLGVLKAGSAYLPLDPTYPKDRLAYLIEDSRAPILLTEAGLLDHLGPHSSKVLLMKDDDKAPEVDPQIFGSDHLTSPLSTGVGGGHEDPTLDNLAYVIYTSGSTGKPKGAMITHRGLANYLGWAVRAYKVAEGRGSPVHSSISFDLTVTSLLAPLVAGRRVDLLDEDLGRRAVDRGAPTVEGLQPGQDHPGPPQMDRRSGRAGRGRGPDEGLRDRRRAVDRRARRVLAPMVSGDDPDQRVRADRDGRWLLRLPSPAGRGRRGADPDRTADRQHPPVRRRPSPPAGAGRRAGRVAHRRPRRGEGLPRPARPDRREVHPGPLRRGPRRPALPIRRPRPLAGATASSNISAGSITS